MNNVTTLPTSAPAPVEKLLNEAEMGAALELFRLPDVSGLALSPDHTPQDFAELADELGERLQHASRVYSEIIKPLIEMQTLARAHVEKAITDAGGRALPHDELEIALEQKYDRRRDVATLREELKGKVPMSEYHRAVFIKSIDIKGVDAEMLANLIKNGAKPTWEIDLRVLDKLAKDYGGEIKATIEKATEKVAVGKPMLTISRRTPPMKVVGGAV